MVWQTFCSKFDGSGLSELGVAERVAGPAHIQRVPVCNRCPPLRPAGVHISPSGLRQVPDGSGRERGRETWREREKEREKEKEKAMDRERKRKREKAREREKEKEKEKERNIYI